MFLIRMLVFAAVLSVASAAAAEPCVLGNANGYREFSVPPNGTCLIKRHDWITKMGTIRVTVPPKRGTFGKASALEMAYRAGNAAGDDYFEYISMETFNGMKVNLRVRNVVHIKP